MLNVRCKQCLEFNKPPTGYMVTDANWAYFLFPVGPTGATFRSNKGRLSTVASICIKTSALKFPVVQCGKMVRAFKGGE